MRYVSVIALALCAALTGCKGGPVASGAYCATAPTGKLPVLVKTKQGRHCFAIERATTAAEQERGLMFRSDLTPDGGMLFWPYPAGGPVSGGARQEANFWMKNTPTSLDILFIRADGTIARIAEDTVPFSEQPIPSGEPVTAVLELVGGRAAALGIAEGDMVSWPKE